MPRVSQERLAATRQQILRGARRAFAKHGFAGATVKVLEAETGLSRGAIFHHFPDKDALFLALAEQDAVDTAETVAEHGLVGAMRTLADRDAGWLGVQLEVTQRLRTDPGFAAAWRERQAALDGAARHRLARQRASGALRCDVPLAVVQAFLTLVFDGLVLHRARGLPDAHLDAVLDLVEETVRGGTDSSGTDSSCPTHPAGSIPRATTGSSA